MLNSKVLQVPGKRSNSYRSAFTLVELSISLLIIGLIIGAVTSGTTLVKQATLRAVVSEVRNYQTAINTFKLQYGYIPGDLPNATSYWNTTNNGSLATSLANGNGNGYWDSATETSTNLQMLSLAGLLNNSVGYNVSAPSKYGQNNNYVSVNNGISAQTFYGRGGAGGDYIYLGGGGTSPTDAYNIDVKMDDGILYSGIAMTSKISANTAQKCTLLATSYQSTSSTAPAITADSYYFLDTTPSCQMGFFIVD